MIPTFGACLNAAAVVGRCRTFLLSLVCSALLAPVASAADGRSILATIPPVYALVSALGEGVFDARQLVPAGTSPHDYQPSPADVRRIARADAVVLNGLGLDDWLLRLLKSAEADGKTPVTLKLSDGLESGLISLPSSDHDHAGHDHGGHDPHFWLDPLLLAQAATNLTRQFTLLVPGASARLASNREQVVRMLHELNQQLEATLAPVREKPFLTQHNGFAYFVRRHRLNLCGVLETTSEVSPSAKELAALLRSAKQAKVAAVFSDESGSQRLVDQVADDLKIKKASLSSLETMSGGLDAYAAAMKRNAATLASTLRE